MNFKDKLNDPTRILTTDVVVIPSAVVTQAVAAAGLDAVIIDQEHGAVGRDSMHAMIAATAGTECAPLVRIVEMGDAHVKAALDLGAEGIVFPLVRTAEDAAACVRSMRYAPTGLRGWGPFIGHSRWGGNIMEHMAEYGEKTVCCLLIETAEALENIDEILSTPGVDCAVLAQFDMSAALGIFGQFGHPDFVDACKRVEAAAQRHGIPLGGGPARTEEEVNALVARGYRMVAGFDVLRLKGAVAQSVAWAANAKRG